ncbi:class I SAM-dependent RNA methyltransferase [Natronoglycomyces albus]|uniref:Class I SAM-dependent RNA methyltransferase n=1 Tax=Natronoglycomyces albus TaxID=2811108 RepID=A0A895XV45_9ACTN|nr:TRAM domain-containing protein [Natronoglycomyces albus]QSB06396.1 class I SAM-dependent RNA methyltransferase [Natronoglycomyces albus]
MIVTVEAVAHGGHCVARAEGRVIFVRHALPGERVRLQITDRKKNFWRADAVEILEPSPDRVAPPCEFAGPGKCGGCDFQHVDPAAQRRLKAQVLTEQLQRLGGVDTDAFGHIDVQELPGGPLGWRTRMQYAVGRDGRPGLRGHRSHQLIHIDRCLLATDRIQASEALKKTWDRAGAVGVVDSDDDKLAFYTQRSRTAKTYHAGGPKTIHQQVGGAEFELDYDSFWQVHPAAAETFANTVIDLLEPQAGESAWDLYAGAGVYAMALAEEVGEEGRVIAVESSKSGRGATNLAEDTNAGMIYGDVAETIPPLGSVDLVALDPPRSGAGADVVAHIANARPRAIAYVACDPAALARDVRSFGEHGYELVEVKAFDSFPMTHHFETIALLHPQADQDS